MPRMYPTEERKQTPQRTTGTADRTVPNESNRRRHNWTIPTDGAGKQIHLDGAGLLLKMARSISNPGYDSQ
ncbi:hypothetical protein T08_8409 [Trichinella sp. T8]|nr:hypothetical protein T08_8409 [Trichinella sp. T8]